MGRPPKQHLIFVYGTLRRGGHYHPTIEKAKFVGFGTTQGKLYNMGRFPAAVFGENGTIRGEVYVVDKDMIDRMDAIEGFFESKPEISFYVRRMIPITMDGGETRETWAYECTKIQGKPEIKSGDYMEFLKSLG